MKKIYISPNTIVVKISLRHHLMDVSYGDAYSSLNSMDYDTETTGGEQMTRRHVWDDEW